MVAGIAMERVAQSEPARDKIQQASMDPVAGTLVLFILFVKRVQAV